MSEKTELENYGSKQCKKLGLWPLKLAVLGGGGWPDHTILGKGGRVCFIEYKMPKGRFQPLQEYYLKMLTLFGFIAEVCRTKEEIDEVLRRFTDEV